MHGSHIVGTINIRITHRRNCQSRITCGGGCQYTDQVLWQKSIHGSRIVGPVNTRITYSGSGQYADHVLGSRSVRAVNTRLTYCGDGQYVVGAVNPRITHCGSGQCADHVLWSGQYTGYVFCGHSTTSRSLRRSMFQRATYASLTRHLRDPYAARCFNVSKLNFAYAHLTRSLRDLYAPRVFNRKAYIRGAPAYKFLTPGF